MSYRDTMELPIMVFWQISGLVPRLIADEHKGLLEVIGAAQSAEGSKQLHEALHSLSPDPVKLSVASIIEASSQRDQAGFDELRSLM